VLLVEPNDAVRAILRDAAARVASRVECHAGFTTARDRLEAEPFDFLVTNMRLDAYNGLHLVYLASAYRRLHAIVYTNERDPGLANEVQHAGAFYEIMTCLPVTLPAYLSSVLPSRDRRDPAVPERRSLARGGRRCWDLHRAISC
jgi:DNA-binding NtrC family response regulator